MIEIKLKIIALSLVLGLLASCTPAQMAATYTSHRLDPGQISYLQQTCVAVKPGVDAAMGSNMPERVSGTAGFIKTYCDQLLRGVIPATTDETTPSWMARMLEVLRNTAIVAGIVLPRI